MGSWASLTLHNSLPNWCKFCSTWREGDEHKKRRRPGFNPQIKVTVDSDGYKCLQLQEDAHVKTHQGGVCERLKTQNSNSKYGA